jgi:hypothetical protein
MLGGLNGSDFSNLSGNLTFSAACSTVPHGTQGFVIPSEARNLLCAFFRTFF